MFLKATLDYVKVRYLNRYLGEKGQGIVEYALILAFVVVVAAAITNAGGLRTKVQAVFTDITNAFGSGGGTGTGTGSGS